ncbi:MAG: hypothetical protein GX942_01750 [Papillibacter sp.]|jgi:hypothetical protein|nr:hypothetical protein [Papillibacter sp.]
MKGLNIMILKLSNHSGGSRGYTLVMAVLSCVIALGFASAVLTSAYSNYMRTVLSEREEQLRLYLSSGAELIADGLHTAELKLETVEAVCQEDALRNCAETTSGGLSISGEPWVRQLITAALEGGGSFSLSAEISGSEVVWDCSYSQLNKNITGLPDENDVFSINIKCSSELGEKEKTLSVSLSVSVSSYTIRQQTEEEGGTYNYVYTYREYRYIFV